MARKLFDSVPRIEGEKIILDRVVDADAWALQELVDNRNVYRYLPTFLFEKQRDDVHETIRLLYENLFAAKEAFILGVRMVEDGSLCGLLELYGYREPMNKISMGYRFRECCWGRGIATQAVALAVDDLYANTDIELITASTMVENVASARVLEKNGFIRTARNVEEDWGFETPTIADKWFRWEAGAPRPARTSAQFPRRARPACAWSDRNQSGSCAD